MVVAVVDVVEADVDVDVDLIHHRVRRVTFRSSTPDFTHGDSPKKFRPIKLPMLFKKVSLHFGHIQRIKSRL